MTGGSQWIAGFLSFFLVEILSCVGIHAMLHGGGSIRAMQKSVGAAPGAVLNAAAILCASLLLALHSYFKLFPLAEYLPSMTTASAG